MSRQPDTAAPTRQPRLLVLSSLFPSAVQPEAGVFIRERMFRVATHLSIVVVAPQPWFPLQGLIRLLRPHFRPMAPRFEVMQGVEVHRPRFLSFPGALKASDGILMALGSYRTVKRLVRSHQLNAIDAHFGYPDGRAATFLGRWLRLPVMITLRGKEERQLRTSVAGQLRRAIRGADRLVCVSAALREIALGVGAAATRVTVIGNGVDLDKFRPLPRDEARRTLDLPADARILISVGTLIERKGFHRVIACLPALLERVPNLHYLIIGGPGPAGDLSERLRAQVQAARLGAHVHFLGPYAPEQLRVPLSAADLFVLATSYEGWANVFLEAMACGLPIVTTRVGGNAEVVCSGQLGTLVDLHDQDALTAAIVAALDRQWDTEAIMAQARSNAWDDKVALLLDQLRTLVAGAAAGGASPEARSPEARS